MKIDFLKSKNNFKKDKLDIKPNTYWRYILYITFVLIIFSFAFGLYFFIKTNEELTSSEIEINEQESIKKENINKVLNYFKEHQEKSIEILNSPSPIVDPSL